MLGKIAFAGFLGLFALCSGCTLPCHPFDYNGPVYDSSGQCVSNARAGSILADGDVQSISTSMDQGVLEETTSNVEQKLPMIEEHEGAKQLLSVTDRKVEEPEAQANSQSESDQSTPLLAQPAMAKHQLKWK